MANMSLFCPYNPTKYICTLNSLNIENTIIFPTSQAYIRELGAQELEYQFYAGFAPRAI